MTRVLTREDIGQLITMEDVLTVVEAAHAEHAQGSVAMPNRFSVALPGTDSTVLPMVAALRGIGAVGLKLLTIFPENRLHGIPVLDATMILIDPDTGQCDAIMDGGLLTAFRTASASAVATKHLARRDAEILGLVGLGVEGRAHFTAIRLVRSIERVIGWTRSAETAQAFRDHVGSDAVVEIVSTPEDVVRKADILCTVTPSRSPIVLGRWVAPGTHINAVGTHERTHREIDTDVVTRSKVVVDVLDAVLDECGDLNIPVEEGAITTDHFSTELGEVVTGAKMPRQTDEDITLYKSVGVALQDVATAHLLLRLARRADVGVEISMS